MSNSRISPSQVVGIFLGLVFAGLVVYFWSKPGVFSKLQVIVHHNWFFWIMIISGIVYAFWRRYQNPEQFVWGEVPVQIIASAAILYLITHFFFFKGSDVGDIEVWNGYISSAEYHEEYDVETCTRSCDSDGNNCTETCNCFTYPPEWLIRTNNNESISIKTSQYGKLKVFFGNESRIGSAGDRCNYHAGTIYATKYRAEPDKLIPTAHEHDYVNYLKASSTIRKTSGGNTTGYEKFLVAYPRVHGGEYGNIYMDRVITTGVEVPDTWQKTVDAELDKALTRLGKEKETNILVYLVGTEEQAFVQALEEHWIMGKKNDIVVVLGVPEFPKVSWSHVMAWTEVEEFRVGLNRRISDIGDISNAKLLTSNIIQQTSLPAEKGGYERTSMKELKYLAAEVKVAWWAQLMILLIYAFLTWLCSWALEHNEIASYVNRAYQGSRFNRFRT